MPIILPPDDTTIYPQEESKKPEFHTWEEYRRGQIFMNVPPWKCECGIVNFGRNRNCARDTCKKPRPADYKIGNPLQKGNDYNPWRVK